MLVKDKAVVREKRLQTQLRKIQAELREIEERESRTVNRSFMGKYFKFYNRYGTGEAWWMYGRVVATDEHGLVLHSFQRTDTDMIEFAVDRQASVNRHRPGELNGWVEATQDETRDALHAIKVELAQRETIMFNKIAPVGQSCAKK